MHMLSDRRLLTCRYWAFGPGCPDIGARNIQTCPYAHWDTGKLADFYEQRGTCYEWFCKRSCPFVAGCSYEHRDTGVMGLHQGSKFASTLYSPQFPLKQDAVLILHGLNLEIADAARRSGFNTRNHAALMDLIWSVRRITFRHGVERPTINRPPRHPIYPDRFRPGNGSDKTQTVGKRGRVLEKPRMGSGTHDDPIDVDDEEWETNGGGTAAKRPVKRLKVVAEHFNPHRAELPLRPKILNPVYLWKTSTTSSKTTYPPSPRSRNLPSRAPSVRPIVDEPRALLAAPLDMTIVELQKVGNTLKDNVDAVVKCGKTMKALYDRDDRLGDEVIYKELEGLKNIFDNCFRDAKVGMTTVQKVIGFLEGNEDRVSIVPVEPNS